MHEGTAYGGDHRETQIHDNYRESHVLSSNTEDVPEEHTETSGLVAMSGAYFLVLHATRAVTTRTAHSRLRRSRLCSPHTPLTSLF